MSDLLSLLCPVDRRRRPIHLMVYGDAGSKKSTLVASMPWPQYGFLFDPLDKAAPYFRDGRVGDWNNDTGYPSSTTWDAFGTPIIQVWHPTEDRLIRVLEHYIDADPYNPDAYLRYARRMGITKDGPVGNGAIGAFTNEFAKHFGTVWWDSVTFFGLSRRKLDEFVWNRVSGSGNSQHGKQWWGAEARAIENECLRRAISLPTNVAVVTHINDDKQDVDGKAILLPAAPGKLPRRLPPGFGECYRAFRDDSKRWHLQTEPNAMFAACTQIPAPDGVEPSYEALWAQG